MKLRQARKIVAQEPSRSRYDYYVNTYWLYRWFEYEPIYGIYTRRDHRITKAIRLLRKFCKEEYNYQCLYKYLGLKKEKIWNT